MYFDNYYYMSPEFKNHLISKEINKFNFNLFNLKIQIYFHLD